MYTKYYAEIKNNNGKSEIEIPSSENILSYQDIHFHFSIATCETDFYMFEVYISAHTLPNKHIKLSIFDNEKNLWDLLEKITKRYSTYKKIKVLIYKDKE